MADALEVSPITVICSIAPTDAPTERALIKVLDAIIATPDRIGRTYWRTRTTDDWQFHALTCLFADADISNYEWMGRRQMPPDAIRFTFRDEVMIKVEARFDGSFDTYNMRFFGDCELKDKCGRVIALVASARVMPWQAPTLFLAPSDTARICRS
jgi:hypothetical protein